MKSKIRGKARGGSRSPRVVSRNVAPAIVAMSRALRDARTKAELSKATAADKIGVHFVTLYAWENENRTDQPSDENLAKAAKAYGTTAETLQRRAKAIEAGLSAESGAGDASESAAAPAAKKAPAKRGRPAKVKTRGAQRAEAPAPPVAKRPVGRPRSTPAVSAPVSARVSAPANGRVTNHAQVTLSHQAYARVLRVLADLAEDLSLSPSALGAAQQALTAPGMLDVFAAFTSAPMTDADILNAIDATSVAVRSFVAARKVPAGQR